ncbi:MAG TPA: SCO family protein [Rhodocyclaceae bacterium]
MTPRKLLLAASATLLALSSTALSAQGHEGHQNHGAPAAAEPAQKMVPLPGTTAAQQPKPKRDPLAYFTDRQLIDQNGKPQRFYSDVLKGRTVVINTAYTSCSDACPLITEQMVRVRAQLGDVFGKDIFFVTISSDPETDTPQAMKAFAQKNKADVPGWVWLTGKKDDVDHILRKLGQWSQFAESHATHLIVWNFKTDRGRKMLPNIAPEALAAQMKLMISDDGARLPGLFN